MANGNGVNLKLTPLVISFVSGILGLLVVVIGWYFAVDREHIITSIRRHREQIHVIGVDVEVVKDRQELLSQEIRDHLNNIERRLDANRCDPTVVPYTGR